MRRSDFAHIVRIAALSALAGAGYSVFMRGSPMGGAATGAILGAFLSWMEIAVFAGEARHWLDRLPFALYFLVRVAAYFTAILVVNLAVLAIRGQIGDLDASDLAFALVACVVSNIVVSVNELLGPGVMFAVAAGRYRRPMRERRILLYADLTGSTGIAEALGEEQFLDLLNAFFDDIATAIVREGGEIHKYVGDEVIATWPDGADPARPVRACFHARRRIAARAPWYREKFGAAPAFRAAIHEGPVVLGELGATRKEIALIGDAMNVAARLLESAREAGAFVLVSAPLYERLSAPPPGIFGERLPALTPRGKSAPVQIVSLRET